jgi:hypothetical protein
MVERGLAAEGPQGDAIRALHALPQKVYVTDQPSGLLDKGMAKMHGDNLLGLFRPRMGTGYSLLVNTDAHKNLGLTDKDILATLAHESGHGLAQIAGVGGVRQPMGIGVVDMLANGVLGNRLPNDVNESLADAIGGITDYGKPSKQVQEKADLVRAIMKKKVK